MFSKAQLLSFIFAIVLAITVFYIRSNSKYQVVERLKSVLQGLLRAESKVPEQHRTKVAVGFGGCYDAFLPALDAFNALNISATGSRVHHDLVNNAEELEQLFNYFFHHGAAAERYVSNKEFFQEVISMTQRYENTRWEVGGNAPVMAKRLALEGSEVLLGAQRSPNVVFGEHVTGIGHQDADDVHIIFEYDKRERWGNLTAPRANRLIIHNDQFNPMLNMLEEFAIELKKFHPKLFVLGGLQMMDNFPFADGVRENRLNALEKFLKDMAPSTLTHFEMASFTEESLLKGLIAKVLPYAESLGMNEQELPNLLAVLNNKPAQLVADSNPRVATTLDEIRELFTAVDKLGGSRKLTRVHVHTLAYQAIVTVKGSKWTNTMSATAKASLVANRHVCGNTSINLDNARLILDESFSSSRTKGSERIHVEDNRPVSCWEEGAKLFCVAPNLVCTDIYQTAGGGDNISGAGLSLQIK
ncbi:ADP-dependent glucokinase-like [Watersipora subatra]|uniref:ADP-dependent glucokinase-like n=1 Tax=Watersipora subatra TaxID=2589382 RepID=UPI00355ACDBA